MYNIEQKIRFLNIIKTISEWILPITSKEIKEAK